MNCNTRIASYFGTIGTMFLNFSRKEQAERMKTLNDKDTSNVQLSVQDQVFYAHREVLSQRSEYFKTMFFGGLQESQTFDTIKVLEYDFNPSVFHNVLSYIYTGGTDITTENVVEVLYISDYFCLNDLADLCDEYVMNSAILNEEEMIAHINLFAGRLKIVEHILKKWVSSKKAQWVLLNRDGLEAVLKMNYLIKSEDQVLLLVLDWVDANIQNTVEQNSARFALAQHIRFSTMNETQFNEALLLVEQYQLRTQDEIKQIRSAIQNKQPFEQPRMPSAYFEAPFPIPNFMLSKWENPTTPYLGYERIEHFENYVRVHFPYVYIAKPYKVKNNFSNSDPTEYYNRWYRVHGGAGNINGVLGAQHLSKCFGLRYKSCSPNGNEKYPVHAHTTLPMMYYYANNQSPPETPDVCLDYQAPMSSVNDMTYFEAYLD